MIHNELVSFSEQAQEELLAEASAACHDPTCTLSFFRSIPRPLPLCPSRPLPQRTRKSKQLTLVLDLDETLVHSESMYVPDFDTRVEVELGEARWTVWVRYRPGLFPFLKKANKHCEVVLFTAGLKAYADAVLRIIDPNRRLLRHRYYRDSCLELNGVHMKDLSILGRDLGKVVLVDNSMNAFACNLDNGILVPSWFNDTSDSVLRHLWTFVQRELLKAEDVTKVLERFFGFGRLLDKF